MNGRLLRPPEIWVRPLNSPVEAICLCIGPFHVNMASNR
jgi:hypothetical protein